MVKELRRIICMNCSVGGEIGGVGTMAAATHVKLLLKRAMHSYREVGD